MRRLVASALLFLPSIALCQAAAQTSPNPHPPATDGKVHCSFQPPPASGDALAALVAGNADRAQSLYAAQLASSPSPAAYAGLIRAQLAGNNLTAALAAAKSALAAIPTSPEVQASAGDVLLRSGQLPEADTAYSRSLSLDTCSARSHFGKGLINQLLARHADARHELDVAHKLSPNDPEITAAYLISLSEADRATPLNAFLSAKPLLPPDRIDDLTRQLAILQAHALCKEVEPIQTVKLSLSSVMLNGTTIRSWGFNTRLNNDTQLLELDSSVSGIFLDEKQAAKAAVRPLIPGATTVPYTGVVDHLKIGSVQYRDCPVRVVASATLAGANGLIGLDVFRDHLIHIDFPDQSITLSPLPDDPLTAAPGNERSIITPTNKGWSQVYIDGGDILVPTLINKQGPFLFALDTGVVRTVISSDATSRTLGKTPDGSLAIRGISGPIVKVIPKEGGADLDRADVYSSGGALLKVSSPVKFPTLRFAGTEFPAPNVMSFDITPKSHATAIEVSGLLGFDVLRSFLIDINYRDGLARILFDQNRRYLVQQADKTYLGNYY
jgi:tetratricopeptide (TPR) repeat protein